MESTEYFHKHFKPSNEDLKLVGQDLRALKDILEVYNIGVHAVKRWAALKENPASFLYIQ
jgi:hypothetical protein